MITITTSGPVGSPPVEPITLDDARAWLVGITDDNAIISNLIIAARVYVESYTSKFLIQQTVTQTMDCFPSCSVLKLAKGPVMSLTSITGYDAEGEDEVLDPDQYLIDTAGARVILKDGASWPTVEQAAMGAVVVYTAGYGASPESVPEAIRQAMRHLMAHIFIHRETNEPVPAVVDEFLRPYKNIRV